VGKGRMVAESTSSVGRGTAGLLLMKGMPPPLSGTNGTVTGEPACAWGAGPGEEAAWCGRKGHGNEGEDGTSPPEEGAGVATGEGSGTIAGEATSMASFSESLHAVSDPLWKVK